jgi:EpsI family protein
VSAPWRLAITLALLGAGAAALHVAPPVRETVRPGALYGLPASLGSWAGTEGAPETALPADPGERVAVRRTYRSGERMAWVSVALFAGQDNSARRPSHNLIYPQEGASLIERVPFTVALNGTPGSALAMPALVVHRGPQRLLVAYWHQVGRRAYGSEYGFRLVLLRDILLSRQADSLLVRIAVPVGGPQGVPDALATVADLAPRLHAALAEALPR